MTSVVSADSLDSKTTFRVIYKMSVYKIPKVRERRHTAQAPAIEATIPLEINIGFRPLVLLKTAPLIAPAAMLFVASCLPR